MKSDVIAKIQAVIGDNAIFASNTSTLPITSLAAEFKDPKRFIGVHFFSPVAIMMLTEVIMGKETGDRALAVGARLHPRHQEDADRRQRLARLLRQPLRAQLHQGRPFDAAGGHSAGDDREHRAHGRHAGRPAVAQRRNRARPWPQDRARHRSRSRRRRGRAGHEDPAGEHGREAAAASAARTARASTIIRPARRRNSGRALPICCRRS